jgi:hypothetical protein
LLSNIKKALIMKRTILTAILVATSIISFAQPKAAGLRLGITGIEADYQYTIQKNQFVEGGIGLDFGFGANSNAGLKATGTYNFIWARPAWTEKGKWALYAGAGATLGWVNDEIHFDIGDAIIHYLDNGFMLGLCGQVGLEYTFWFPLQISLDLRPTIAMHVDGGKDYMNPITGNMERHDPHVGFYDNGLLGLIPHISVRYSF